ncbi:MAG TPA: VTT domain-containing protein [Alphaproteobacteria bacterium]|jgi:membrane protein DedA with SNARE-associated domain/rhodanese-related sulfurtransferase|nr:VTT domain-containing protein [Alphaproteobacteria bacterium]
MPDVVFLIQHYGVPVVFLNVLLAYLGLPLPIYPTLLLAGALTASGAGSVWLVIAAATAGAVIADGIWFVAGRHYGRRALALVCKVSLSPDSCVRRTESAFSRTGPWTLLFAKFLPGLSYVSVALCGATGVRASLFILADAIGAALYVALAVALGWLFRDAIDAVVSTLVQLGAYGVVLVVAALGAYLAIRWIERRLFIRRLRMDRISVEELAEMIDRGEAPVILDVRSADLRLSEGMIPGSIAAGILEAPTALKGHSLTVEVVVYCSCPNEASAAMAAMHLKRAGFRRIRPLLGGIEAWSAAGRPIELGA